MSAGLQHTTGRSDRIDVESGRCSDAGSLEALWAVDPSPVTAQLLKLDLSEREFVRIVLVFESPEGWSRQTY